MNPVRVLVVSLDGGAGAATLSRDPAFIVEAVNSFRGAADAIRSFPPAGAVVAFEYPQPIDVGDLRRFSRASGVPVLVISKPVEERLATELIKAGAGGYLFVEDSFRLGAAVLELLRGGVPMSKPVSRIVLGRARRSSAKMAAVRPDTESAEKLLTTRQREILRLLANGHSYEHIGVALGLSVNTVRSHLRTIYERLGASTKVEAVMTAVELRLLDRDPLR